MANKFKAGDKVILTAKPRYMCLYQMGDVVKVLAAYNQGYVDDHDYEIPEHLRVVPQDFPESYIVQSDYGPKQIVKATHLKSARLDISTSDIDRAFKQLRDSVDDKA